MKFVTQFALALTLCISSFTSFAEYTLVNKESTLNFVSIKKNTIAEVHHFSALSGQINDDGAAQFTIDLSSVETGIPIRNERMNSFLFNTSEFATSTATTNVDVVKLQQLSKGSMLSLQLPVTINLHGIKHAVNASVEVSRINDNKIAVYSTQPVIINANNFGLVDGINKLQSLAGLPSIAMAVPVTFKLVFES